MAVTRSPERSAVHVLMVAVVALAFLLALAVGRLGTAAVSTERAQAGADAVALAAAVGGADAAHQVAAANGVAVAAVEGPIADGSTWVVEVELAGASAIASARATAEPGGG